MANREIVVGSGKSASVSFEGFADHSTYEAEIANRDALPLDNRRFAVAPASRNLRILGITPRPRELESLKAIPGVQIDTIAPSDYDKAERSGYGLEIFHFATPDDAAGDRGAVHFTAAKQLPGRTWRARLAM